MKVFGYTEPPNALTCSGEDYRGLQSYMGLFQTCKYLSICCPFYESFSWWKFYLTYVVNTFSVRTLLEHGNGIIKAREFIFNMEPHFTSKLWKLKLPNFQALVNAKELQWKTESLPILHKRNNKHLELRYLHNR